MMADSDSDSSEYATGTDSEDESEDEPRNSVNVWDLPPDQNTINRKAILQNVHQSQSLNYIQQKQQQQNAFAYNNNNHQQPHHKQNNMSMNMNMHKQRQQQFNQNHNNYNQNNNNNSQRQQPVYSMSPPPPNMYNNHNNQNMNMYNQMKQVQLQSYSVQNMHSAPKRNMNPNQYQNNNNPNPIPIEQSHTMPAMHPSNQMAYVKQHSNSHHNLNLHRMNNNNQNNNNFNHRNNGNNNNMNMGHNRHFSSNNNGNNYNRNVPQNNNNNNFNLRQMQHQFMSTPNLHSNNTNSFVPPSPQDFAEQQKYNNWKSKRKLMDDEKAKGAQEMKALDDIKIKEAEWKKQQWLNGGNVHSAFDKGNNGLMQKKNHRRTKSTGSILKKQNDYLQQPLKVGYMLKEGKFVKSWKRRWFVLRVNGKMSYYKTQNAKKPISTFDCNKATKIINQKWGNKQWGLVLFTPNRNWKFVCTNSEERKGWFQAFSNCITVRK